MSCRTAEACQAIIHYYKLPSSIRYHHCNLWSVGSIVQHWVAKRRTDTNLTTIWNSIKTQGVCKPEGERGGKAQKIKTLNWRKEEVENDSIPISWCSGDNYKSIPIHLGWA